MALKWAEGFDWFTDDVGDPTPADFADKYDLTGSGHDVGPARDFGKGFRSPSSTANTEVALRSGILGQAATVITGFAFKTGGETSTTGTIFEFRDTVGADFHAVLRVSGTDPYSMFLFGGNPLTTLGTVTNLNADQWYFVEVKILFDNSGTFEVKIDGVSEFSGSHDMTRTANAWCDEVSLFHGNFRNCDFDDWYVLDGTGSQNNDFLGDVSARVILPNSDGGTTNWTPNTGSDHFALVDETETDDDTTYLEADALNTRDLFGFENLSGGSTIHGLQIDHFARVTDASAFDLRRVISSGATVETDVAGNVTSTSYDYFHSISEEDPNTSAAWNLANLNNAEIGIEVGT